MLSDINSLQPTNHTGDSMSDDTKQIIAALAIILPPLSFLMFLMAKTLGV